MRTIVSTLCTIILASGCTLDAADDSTLNAGNDEAIGTADQASQSWYFAYAAADQPLTADYAPANQFSSGAPLSVHRNAIGGYVVTLPDGTNALLPGPLTGLPHVTAIGSEAIACRVTADSFKLRPPGIHMVHTAYVTCFDAAGQAADSKFALDYVASPGVFAGAIAFAEGDQPSAASYAPSDQYDNAGGSVTITRQSAGKYSVNMPNMASLYNDPLAGAKGTVKVTARGSSAQVCNATGWSMGSPMSRSSSVTVNVLCTDMAGQPVDSAYAVTFARRSNLMGIVSTTKAYVYADQPNAASYIASAPYSYDPFGPNTVTRSGAGVYAVKLNGVGATGGEVQVTAVTSGGQHCKAGGWSQNGLDEDVEVRCFAPGGAPADAAFALSFTKM